MNQVNQCPSCSTPITGEYCSHCGEAVLTSQNRKLSHLVGDFLQSITKIDGKLLRTLGCLCFKPGVYDNHYHLGARNQYIKPISLFLLVNVLFVSFIPINDFFLMFLDQRGQIYYPWVKDWVDANVAQSGLALKEYGSRYNQMVKVLARSIIITSVPFFMIFVVLIFNNRRYYLSDHLVFSLNTYAFFMLAMLVFWFIAQSIVSLFEMIDIEITIIPIFTGLMGVSFFAYLSFAALKMYQVKTWTLIWRIPLLFIGIAASHMIYRLIQLVATITVLS